MTGFQVERPFLHGYAAQLRANADAVTTVSEYAKVHCHNFDRISGLLEPAEWISSFAADTFVPWLPTTERVLRTTSDQLTKTATAYTTADHAAAQRFDGQQGGTDTTQPAPGFTGGASVAPKPPTDEVLTGWVEEKLADLLGEVAGVVKFFTGYDIIAEWTPVLLGDWGALNRLAEAWGEVTHSARAIHEDVTAGLDTLTPHWLGGAEKSAAAYFDQHMRNRVLGGIETLAEAADMMRAAHECWSKSYEAIITNAFWLLDYYAVRFKSVVNRIRKAAKDLTLDPRTWWDLGEELFSIGGDYLEFIKTTIDAIVICIEQYKEMGQLLVDEIDYFITLTTWQLKAATMP
ncbi:hypothetical protein [Actinophytocola sediminis]